MVTTEFNEAIISELNRLNDDAETVVQILSDIVNAERVFLIGNGGSAAICEHIANDLMKRCRIQAPTLSSAALITCLANDYGFENMYLKFLQAHKCNMNDIIIAISSSGISEDILCPLYHYKDESNIQTIGISGFYLFPDDITDIRVDIQSHNYGVVEMVTEIFLHGIIEEIVWDLEGNDKDE
ncbi:MAG: SIS domain-containing protein [SAR202 cluster bacterium]|jgi:D-sedoheptulose 7-phosphate isomerase|nr:SIS domain-containing protein [SAR202 cluster bacterium]